MKKGLVTVTFRKLDPYEIIDVCKKAGLEYTEWGGDIHVPSGDTARAAEVRAACADAGIIPAGYGSYYNAADGTEAFYPALETAHALGAEYIRIWAGKSKEYDKKAEENIKAAVKAAEPYNIAVTLECHRKTMTEDASLAVKLAEECGCRLHFQPNPDISFDENLKALTLSAPYLCACHVFAWEKGNLRLPLKAQEEQWIRYAKVSPDTLFLLEFVAGDEVKNAYADALELDRILRKAVL